METTAGRLALLVILTALVGGTFATVIPEAGDGADEAPGGPLAPVVDEGPRTPTDKPAAGGTGTRNDPPYVRDEAPDSFTIAEDAAPGSLYLSFIFEDPDLDPLTFSVLDGSWGTSYNDGVIQASIMSNNDTLKVWSHKDKYGEVDLQLRATDLNLTSAEYTLTIVINPTNDAPTLDPIDDDNKVTFYEDEPVELYIYAEDKDGDVLDFSDDTRLFDVQSYEDQTGLISFTPTNEDVGEYEVELVVRDAKKKLEVLLEVTIVNTNDAPEFTKIDGADVREGEVYKYNVRQNDWLNLTLKARDVDKQNVDEDMTFSTDFPFENVIDPRTGDFHFHATNEHVGSLTGKLIVKDRAGERDEIDLQIVVQDVNDPPNKPEISQPLDGSTIDMGKDGVRFIAGLVNDPDGDEVTYTWDFGDGKGAEGKTANHVYKYSGSFNVTLSVTDGKIQNPRSTEIRIYVSRNESRWDSDEDSISDDLDDDDDNDGMPDLWETAYGLDPYNASDGAADLDGDGYTNLQEYQAGTFPTDAGDNPATREEDDEGDGGLGGIPLMYIVAIVAVVIIVAVILVAFRMQKVKKQRQLEDEERERRRQEDLARQKWDEERRLYGTTGPPPGGAQWGGGGPGTPAPAPAPQPGYSPGAPQPGPGGPPGGYKPGGP